MKKKEEEEEEKEEMNANSFTGSQGCARSDCHKKGGL